MQESELAFQECLKAIAPVVPFVGAASAPNEPLAWELESFPQLTLTRLERLAGLEYHAILDGLSHPDIAYAEELTFRGLTELAAQLWWIFRGDLLKEGEIRPETDNPRRRTLCYEFGAQRQLSQAIEAAPNSALIEGQKAGSATRLGLIKALHEKGGCAAGCDGRGYKQAEQAVAQLAADLKMDHLVFTWRFDPSRKRPAREDEDRLSRRSARQPSRSPGQAGRLSGCRNRGLGHPSPTAWRVIRKRGVWATI